MCGNYCEYGYALDDRGCETCNCFTKYPNLSEPVTVPSTTQIFSLSQLSNIYIYLFLFSLMSMYKSYNNIDIIYTINIDKVN